MNKLSVIIITKNEEKNIRRCLDCVKWADEIVVVDQSSTDNTVDICKEYTDKVFTVLPKGFCEPDRATALAKTTNEWVLYIDADEVVSLELKAEIEALFAVDYGYDCYYVPRRNIFLGKWIKGSGWYPGYVLRVFKKGSVNFPEGIHGDILSLHGHGYLKGHLSHYTCVNLKEYISKSNRYSSILASQAYVQGERISVKNFAWKFFLLPVIYFLYKLIIKLGVRDGYRGFLIAALTFWTVFFTNIKLWLVQKKQRINKRDRRSN